MATLITRTTVQNRAILETRRRQLDLKAVVVKRDALQAEFDAICAVELDGISEDAINTANELMAQIAKLNKTIGAKSTRSRL
jgi:hypothetical protein